MGVDRIVVTMMIIVNVEALEAPTNVNRDATDTTIATIN
jgi:hypothetical protein